MSCFFFCNFFSCICCCRGRGRRCSLLLLLLYVLLFCFGSSHSPFVHIPVFMSVRVFILVILFNIYIFHFSLPFYGVSLHCHCTLPKLSLDAVNVNPIKNVLKQLLRLLVFSENNSIQCKSFFVRESHRICLSNFKIRFSSPSTK